MNSRIFKRLTALILVMSLMIPLSTHIRATTQDMNMVTQLEENIVAAPEISNSLDKETICKQLTEGTQILKYIDESVFLEGNHIARLTQEEDLSNYVFLNADGTKTVYYMDEAVKFADVNGIILEKDVSLSESPNGFTTTRNNIGLTLPSTLTDGIQVSYNGYDIKLTPEGGSAVSTARNENNRIAYPEYYGPGTSLVYTPTLSGVKEDIILAKYSGVKDFTFLLDTDGLGVYESNGKFYLATSQNAKAVVNLGDVVAYDSAGHFSQGTMSVTTIKDKAQYRVTIHANEEFLLSETTVYPVWIDPTIKVSDSTHGVNAIEDIAIYSGVPTSNCNWQYLICGYADSAYKIGRILVRTPGLTSNAEFRSANVNSITSAKFYIRDASGTAGYPVYLYANTGNASWTESGATWNNAGITLGTKYSTVSPGNNAYAAYDITELVKSWKSSTTAAQRGFVLVSSDESTKNRSFCSSEFTNANSRPYIVVNYQSAAETVDVLEGATLTLSAAGISGTITWASETPSVASINSTTGVVTGIKAGYSRVTASVSGNVEKVFHVYVRIANGVYYLKNNLSGYYLGLQDSGIEYNTPAKQQAKVTTNPEMYSQLWKITYIDQGFYSVRPMHRLNMGLNLSDTTVDIWGATTNDTLSALLTTTRWTITKSGTGYVFNNYGLSNKAMVPYGLSTSINAGITVGTDNGTNAYKWTLEAPANSISNHIIFYDAVNKKLLRNPTICIVPGETYSGLSASFVSTTTNEQNVEWVLTSGTGASFDPATGKIVGNVVNSSATFQVRQTYNNITYLRYCTVHTIVLPEGTYYIKNQETDLYADIYQQTMAAGTIVHQWSSHNGNSQKWVFNYVGDGYYTIKSENSTGDYYLGVSGNSTANNAAIVLCTGTIGDGMKWKIVGPTKGSFELIPKSGESNNYKLVLDAYNGLLAGAHLQQGVSPNDFNFDEWYIYQEINIGLSTDDYAQGCGNGSRHATEFAEDFYSNLLLAPDDLKISVEHHYNDANTATASKADFAVNGAISNSIDFMVYIGHGHAAHDNQGNHLHYDCGILGQQHVRNVTNGVETYTFCYSEGNVYTSDIKFGGPTSKLRWAWLYTCNFLATGQYVTDTQLKNMMNGVHILLGYASTTTLSRLNATRFSDELKAGEKIIDAFFITGDRAEIDSAQSAHIQKVMYLPQARNETIYSALANYESTDIQILTNNIWDNVIWQ